MTILVWAWIHLLFLIEAALVPVALAWRGRFQTVEGRLAKVARRPGAPLVAGVLAVALRLAVLPVEPVPVPGVHDEFSYLLAADTFMHGRLANPTHALWTHFETMQEEHQPTYASMYPPAQGLMLAAGILLSGVAFTGVLLSVGAMCAALCWALAGWFTPGWALLGAVLSAVRLGMFSYCADSYWGGALTATGGALVFGALPRLARGSRVRDAALAGLGIVILLNTRPYEGAVFVLAAGVAWLVLRMAAARRIARLENNQKSSQEASVVRLVGFRWHLVLTLCAILLPAAALMTFYNWRVFGNALTMPYRVNRDTYAVAQIFVWQAPRVPPPVYRHQAMRDFFMGFELDHFLRARTLAGYLWITLTKAEKFWSFYLGPILTVPLMAVAWTLRSRRTRVFLWLIASVAVAEAMTPWFAPHYAAPITAVLWALLIQGMRALAAWRPGAIRGLVLVCAAMVVVRIAMALTPVPFVLNYPMTWATTWTMQLGREEIVDRLKQAGGRHLVIVHYEAGHDPLREYVFNAADIDASEVVWARDMGPDQNSELIRYFGPRKVWLLEADRKPPKLIPYPAPE